MESVQIYHTTIKFKSSPDDPSLSSAVESYRVLDSKSQTNSPNLYYYTKVSQITLAINDCISKGFRTIAVKLPKSKQQIFDLINLVKAHFALNGKQLLYLAFYGNSWQIKFAHSQFSSQLDRWAKLLLNEKPDICIFVKPESDWLNRLTKEFDGTAFCIDGTVELFIEEKGEERLVRSAFLEYLNLMSTKNLREYRKLYNRSIKSSAVCPLICKTLDNHEIRLLVFDNEITLAQKGKSVFITRPFFAVTSFMSQKPTATLFIAKSKSEYF